MSDLILKVSELNKSFGGIQATRDLNIDVRRGEIHAIIGPNGAGKTTLISQLSGQLKPSSGRIDFEGRNITNLSTAKRARRGLARSFQITSVVMPMTLLENVMLAVQGSGGHSFRFWSPVSLDKKITNAAMASLQEVGLDDRAHRIAAEVSHGEQRQLEVAMALAMRPKLLLLDEPMAGMGGEESQHMVDILIKLKQQCTILLIEHDMAAVFQLADQLSVLVSGHIIASDTVENIRANQDVQRAYLGEEHA